jgi:hypothetical protein
VNAAPTDPRDRKPQREPVSPARLTIWVVVGAIGVFLLGSGILGIITKG